MAMGVAVPEEPNGTREPRGWYIAAVGCTVLLCGVLRAVTTPIVIAIVLALVMFVAMAFEIRAQRKNRASASEGISAGARRR